MRRLALLQLAVLSACASPAPPEPTPTAARAVATVAPTRVPPTAAPPTPVPATPVAQPTAVANEIVILDDLYSPSEMTIRVGDTVTWRNYGGKVHDAVSLTGAWSPSLLQPGGRFRVTLTTPGRFEYTCTVHSSMIGWVIVQ